MDKIAVVIPAYNVVHTIQQVIRGVYTYIPKGDIIVVNDGSDDNSTEEIRATGVQLLHHGRNQGKGAALKTAFSWCLRKDYQAVITMDGDGQHSFHEIPQLIRAYFKGAGDIIVGSRMHNLAGIPFQRIITNILSSRLVSFITRQPVADSQSGFRLISSRVLRSVTLTSRRYDIESELLIKAAAAGYTIGTVPVTVIYNQAPSHFRPVRDSLPIFRRLGSGLVMRLTGPKAAA